MSDELCVEGCDQPAHPDHGGCPHALQLCARHASTCCVECRYDLAAAEAEANETSRRDMEALA